MSMAVKPLLYSDYGYRTTEIYSLEKNVWRYGPNLTAEADDIEGKGLSYKGQVYFLDKDGKVFRQVMIGPLTAVDLIQNSKRSLIWPK